MKPIIDVHSHIFNAMDIPLEGYLLSRSCEKKKLYNIEYITSFSLAPKIFAYIAPRMRERCITRELKLKNERLVVKGYIYSFILRLIGLCMRQQISEWEESLSKDVNKLASDLVNIWNEIDLYIPLMIDYEYWFKNTIDNPIKKQIEYIYKKVILTNKGKIHAFAPFDPARELVYQAKKHNPDGELEKDGSLSLVKDAIENKGFIGVKLYNALGYKPFNNKSVDNERKRVAIRNDKMHLYFEGEQYDKVLSELYDYCVDNEVPITTHCGMYGIESYPDASFDFGKAVFWRDVLDQEKYKNLHLNLAHFGWYSKEGFNGKISWVKDICEMLNDYNYLYTDVSCHRVVLRKYFKKFRSDYKQICSQYPIIKERLLFGTDWHVLRRIKRYKKFKSNYIEILKHDNLFSNEDLDNFLGGNALRFLGLYKGGKNLSRLEKFYANHNIDPPEWFKSVS